MRVIPAQTELFDRGSFADAMVRVLDPHVVNQKYGRLWRVSRPKVAVEFIHGRLGFSRSKAAEAVVYDEKALDFVTEPVPTEDGRFAHFSIGIASQILVFETVPGSIDREVFVSRFSDFIRMTDEPYELRAISDDDSFEKWKARVDRVTRLAVAVARPNPDVTKATERTLQKLVDINADKMEIKVESAQPGGINTGPEAISDPIEHALSGYGRARAVGVRGAQEVEFDSQTTARSRLVELGPEGTSDDTFARLDEIVEESATDENVKNG